MKCLLHLNFSFFSLNLQMAHTNDLTMQIAKDILISGNGSREICNRELQQKRRENDILIYQNMQNNCTKFAFRLKGNVQNVQFI